MCGGKSTRMGVPKATLPFGPETMLQRVVRLLGTVASPIVVVAARNQPLPPLPDEVRIARDEREAKGPLEGIRAGLSALPPSVDAGWFVPAQTNRSAGSTGGWHVAQVQVDHCASSRKNRWLRHEWHDAGGDELGTSVPSASPR